MTRLFLIFAFMAMAQDLSQQGAQAMRESRFADAERIYREMLKSLPGDPRVHLNLGLALHSSLAGLAKQDRRTQALTA